MNILYYNKWELTNLFFQISLDNEQYYYLIYLKRHIIICTNV